ncbi:hypothetical protein D3C87_1636670 [compost metagenome]
MVAARRPSGCCYSSVADDRTDHDNTGRASARVDDRNRTGFADAESIARSLHLDSRWSRGGAGRVGSDFPDPAAQSTGSPGCDGLHVRGRLCRGCGCCLRTAHSLAHPCCNRRASRGSAGGWTGVSPKWQAVAADIDPGRYRHRFLRVGGEQFLGASDAASGGR